VLRVQGWQLQNLSALRAGAEIYPKAARNSKVNQADDVASKLQNHNISHVRGWNRFASSFTRLKNLQCKTSFPLSATLDRVRVTRTPQLEPRNAQPATRIAIF